MLVMTCGSRLGSRSTILYLGWLNLRKYLTTVVGGLRFASVWVLEMSPFRLWAGFFEVDFLVLHFLECIDAGFEYAWMKCSAC